MLTLKSTELGKGLLYLPQALNGSPHQQHTHGGLLDHQKRLFSQVPPVKMWQEKVVQRLRTPPTPTLTTAVLQPQLPQL